ncbi:MAG: SU10 major capsid protein [Candidatus Dormibacteria bacterium]
MPSELREALTAAGASALVPKIISPMLLEYQRRYSPLVRSIPSMKWGSDTYYFNQRTVNPNGGFVVDGGARVVSNSTYVQNSFQMKHLQIVGAVTGYAEEVTRMVIGDLRAREIEGSIQGLYWDIEQSLIWGNAGSTQFGPYPQFDGFDSLVNTYSGGNQNALDKAGATMTLAHLDELADMVETNAAMSVFDSSWMFVLSNTAASKVAQLLTNQQRFLDRTEVAAGLTVPTYRDIPLIKSSFLSTRSTTMGAVTTATATTGGTLAANTYYYRVGAVIQRQGEIAASAEVSQTTSGATSTVTLSFSTPSGLDGLLPTLYKVYRSTATGTETLLGVVDANVGFSADGITPILTTSIIDTGATLIPQNGSTQPGTFPATYQGGNTNKFPAAIGQENIFLMARDENFICRPYVRELVALDVYPTTSSPDSLPYAIASDTVLALRGPKYMGMVQRVSTAV